MTDATAFYGPPGTGKTTTLVSMIKAELEEGANVTVVSYTKAAAKEIAERAGGNQGIYTATIHASTIHSLAFGLGGCKMASTVDIDKLKSFSGATGIPFCGRVVTEDDDIQTLEVGDEYMSVYNLARAKLAPYAETYDNSYRPGTADEFAYFCDAYDRWKRTNGYYDFGDMLTRALGKPYKPEVLVVDEAQDLSPAQWELIYQWGREAARVYIAGDDDQAIYLWSGADPAGMQNFEQDFNAKRVVLDQSYRIPAEVHSLANDIIVPVAGRVDKVYRPRSEPGMVDRVDSFTDVVIDPAEPTLVLYRNHSLRRDVEDTLLARSVAHVFDNGGRSVLQSPLADAARSWERGEPWTMIPADVRRGLRRIYSDRQYKAFEVTGEWPFDPLMSSQQSYRLRAALNEYRRKNDGILPDVRDCKLHLSSIHGAKGREADHVVLINGMTGKTATGYELDKDAERRVFYVGVTRARKRLTIVTAENAAEILL